MSVQATFTSLSFPPLLPSPSPSPSRFPLVLGTTINLYLDLEKKILFIVKTVEKTKGTLENLSLVLGGSKVLHFNIYRAVTMWKVQPNPNFPPRPSEDTLLRILESILFSNLVLRKLLLLIDYISNNNTN